MMDEDEAERIRASRGDYEVEFSCNGEGGLLQRRRKCDKNPDHLKFIPVEDFNIEHLPSRYHDNLVVDLVRAQSDATFRLSVSRISGGRPDTWPGSDQPYAFSAFRGKNCLMTGTGWVSFVSYTLEDEDIDCKCDECIKPGNTPKKARGAVDITTARHIVYDDEEARHTKCQFFYDSHETDIKTVPTLTGGKISHSDVQRDWCMMTFATHDVELLDRLDKMYRRWMYLRKQVINKYVRHKSPDVCVPGVGCDTNVDHDLCIIVSHPHGCSKVVTVGTWTRRDAVDKDSHDDEGMTYRYNTPTCPGSSGAGVFTLYKSITGNNDEQYHFFPPHSQGRPDNDNNSGEGWEYVGTF